MRMKWLSTFLLLVLTTEAAAAVSSRWSGSCDFRGGYRSRVHRRCRWRIVDRLPGQPARRIGDRDADRWRSMAFDVSIHGSAFSFKGRTVTEAGIESLSGPSPPRMPTPMEDSRKRSPVVSNCRCTALVRHAGHQGIQQLDMILDLGRTPTIDCMWTSRSRYRRSLGTRSMWSPMMGRRSSPSHTGLPATLTMERSPGPFGVPGRCVPAGDRLHA